MELKNKLMEILVFAVLLLIIYLTNFHSYLLFHSLAEIFSIVIAIGIFMIAWNARRFMDNNYLLVLGIAFLFIGIIDLIHMLAYKGMMVFVGFDANLPTQLWIIARYMQAITLLIAPLFFTKKMNSKVILSVYFAVTTILLGSIFLGFFPAAFVEGVGLTTFKIMSEYIISAILIGAIYLLYKNKEKLDETVFQWLVVSIILTILSELAFTFYIGVYDFSNLVGHILKIIAFFLVYKAIIQTALTKPYNLLFKNLQK